MLKDLAPAQRALEEFMSELSEEAYCAGWMECLEYALWDAVGGGARLYGRKTLSDSEVESLRALSRACGGWIVFDDETEETWLPLSEWEKRAAERKARGPKHS